MRSWPQLPHKIVRIKYTFSENAIETIKCYTHVRQPLFTQKANKTSHSNSGRRHTMSSLEREGRESHSGPFPDFLRTTGFLVTLWAAFEYRAKTL